MASARAPLRLHWAEAGAEGAPDVAQLAAAAFDPLYREAWSETQIVSLLNGGSGWLELGRAADGGLLAFALCRMAVDEVELLLCATHPRARRMGAGRQLVERVRDATSIRGCNRLFLEVRSSNDAALGLYMSAGFAISGRRPGYYLTTAGDRIDALTLLMKVG